MRMILAAAMTCGWLFVTTAPVSAGDREDALAIIDRAVKAHGGADALAKVRTACPAKALCSKATQKPPLPMN